MGFAELTSLINSFGDPSKPGWQNRIKEAAYISPSGTRIVFQFVDLERTIEKRTAKFTFNGLDGAYIQDNGNDEGVYSLECFFTGDDHDRIGTAFEVALTERGRGRLEHPLYGTFDVVPTGTIERSNRMVDEANQTVIRVTFSTTLAEVYPELNPFPINAIAQTIAGWDVASAAEFAGLMDFSDPSAAAKLTGSVRKALKVSGETLGKASEALTEAKRAYDDQERLINESLDTLVGAPLNLAEQLINLIKTPANTLKGLQSRLDGYQAFLESLLSAFDGTEETNDVALSSLLGFAGVSGATLSGNSATYTNRPEALNAALAVQGMQDQAATALDSLFRRTGFVDPGASYQGAQQGAAQLAGRLVSESFDLLPERIITLQRDRCPVELCAELYQRLDDATLQNFLDTNRVGGDDIFFLKRGRRVVYYA